MSSFVLKILAIVFMAIDHVGYALVPSIISLRIIGRMAMPIFAYQIAIGFRHTSSKPKYILRMFLCALISQIPFILLINARRMQSISDIQILPLASENHSLNICFEFLLAQILLFCLGRIKEKKGYILPCLLAILLSYVLPLDYNGFAVLLVVIFYYFGNHRLLYTYLVFGVTVLYCWFDDYNDIQIYLLLAIPILYFYNEKKGKSLKYFFYAFYPLHLVLIFLIKLYLIA